MGVSLTEGVGYWQDEYTLGRFELKTHKIASKYLFWGIVLFRVFLHHDLPDKDLDLFTQDICSSVLPADWRSFSCCGKKIGETRLQTRRLVQRRVIQWNVQDVMG